MKLFITLDQLKHRMAIDPSLEGVNDNLSSAIIASQLRIESYLDSKLEKASYENRYFLDSDAFSGIQADGMFRLYLQSGLVAAAPAPSLSYCDTWNGTYTAVPASDYYINSDKGVCYLEARHYKEYYIRAAFTAGYNKAADLPRWLIETILAYAPVVLNFSQVTNRNNEAEAGYRMSGDHALAIAAPYQRNVGLLVRPMM